jgi:uncharacterized protein (DUF1786 family)
LSEAVPSGHVPVALADYDPGFWRALLGAAGLPEPEGVVACAQDHGFHPGGSNRLGRFELWKRFLVEAQGRPEALIFHSVPSEMTRLATLQRAIGGGPVSDTGAAAVLGALAEPEVAQRSWEEGVCLVNVGNSHIIAFLLHKGRMWGVYEHHTGMLDAQGLWEQLALFRKKSLTNAAVFDSGGHGCLVLNEADTSIDFNGMYVLGPQRGLLQGYDVAFPAPGGDMMLAGCVGLLKGLSLCKAAGSG